MFISFISKLLKRIAAADSTCAASVPVPELQPVAAPPPPVSPATALARMSPAVTRAAELLAVRPRITPAELASELRISVSYARSLMRRARLQPPSPPPEPTCLSDLDGTLQDLQQRLASAERDLAAVRALPVHGRAALNLNRRAEVLRLLGGGLAPESVAERLAIPQGEVEFIRKVDRIVAFSV